MKTLLAAILCLAFAGAQAQVPSTSASVSSSLTANAELPDDPSAQSDSTAQNSAAQNDTSPDHVHPAQTKRILGIIPNFRSVSADAHLKPQSPKEKFTTALQDSFDYSAAIFIGAQAAIYYGSNNTPQFRDGFPGYLRYYWHTFADTADENIWVEGIVPSITHQDNRFYTLGHGSRLKRAEYALTRVAITRNDAGKETFNTSEILGAGIASGISSLYYPTADRTAGKVTQIWYTNVLIDGGTFVFKEFWPDINNAFFHTHD